MSLVGRGSAPAWLQYLAELGPAGFDDRISYRNSKGEDFTNSVDDILTQVLFHSAYHRGQIALEIRLGGGAPAYTDFIHGVRLGLVE